MSLNKMENASSADSINGSEKRFAQNVVAETATIILVIIFGIATSILIVRGLPKVPVYEFYHFVLIFTWIGVLFPFSVVGIDIALIKHLPEIIRKRNTSMQRVVGWAIVSTVLISVLIIIGVRLVLLQPIFSILIPPEVVPLLLLALFTLPLTATSTVLQGIFRGVQEMRFCTYAMGLYHGLYFLGLLVLFLSSVMTLYGVIWLNIGVSIVTIIFESTILLSLLRKHQKVMVQTNGTFSRRRVISTAFFALLLALFASLFLNAPILIANLFRTSDVLLAGLGLAVSVAFYIHQGQAAPFRVLLPKTSEDLARGVLPSIGGYVRQAWKFGSLLNGFVAVIVVFFSAPILIVLFSVEGLVVAPLLALMAGSFVIYPLTVMMMDTLVGVGRIREVLLTYAAWTFVLIGTLFFLCPIGHEVVVALIWIVGTPFLILLTILYQRRTGLKLDLSFLPKMVGVLVGIAVVSLLILMGGSALLIFLNLTGVLSLLLQIGIILSLFPLFLFYFWSLVKTRILLDEDLNALLSISQVLHPLTRPVTWLIQRLK